MNIFEIFSAGKEKINEENMSSVLGFLLYPMSPHGFGRESLGTFLEPIENYIKKPTPIRHNFQVNYFELLHGLVQQGSGTFEHR